MRRGNYDKNTNLVFSSIRERTIAENSMVVLLQGLQGEVTTVDLRNESTARGRVISVDAFMNIRLADTIQNQLSKIHRVRNFASEGGGRKEFPKKTK
uniref:Sm domain-containing protein n=1 Tax=Acanthochromis polyacanthus TaxID=80966 RepID=A0A3Q1G7N1_9TELE